MALGAISVDKNGIGYADKNAAAVLDYPFNFTEWLGEVTDTISSVIVSVDNESGIILDKFNFNNNLVVVWISGGIKFKNGVVTCKITTLAGRTDEFKLKLAIK